MSKWSCCMAVGTRGKVPFISMNLTPESPHFHVSNNLRPGWKLIQKPALSFCSEKLGVSQLFSTRCDLMFLGYCAPLHPVRVPHSQWKPISRAACNTLVYMSRPGAGFPANRFYPFAITPNAISVRKRGRGPKKKIDEQKIKCCILPMKAYTEEYTSLSSAIST